MEPIRRPRLSEEIADRLIANILSGKFAFGEKLPPERDLARYLDVGRPTLREAIMTLRSLGLVEVRHGEGIFIVNRHEDFVAKAFSWVLLLDAQTAGAIMETRIAIEAGLAELAAERATPDDLTRLGELLAELGDSLNHPGRFIAADLEFQLTLARATRNVMLERLLQAVRVLHERWSDQLLAVPGTAELVLEHRCELAEALATRDAAAARAAVREHLEALAERLKASPPAEASRSRPSALLGDEKYPLTPSPPSQNRRSPTRQAVSRVHTGIWRSADAAGLRVGMITPSSNTMVEPISGAIAAPLIGELSVHHARIPVTRISLDQDSFHQFDLDAMLDAARLLADARVHVICWNGISAAYRGSASDRWICEAIQRETGVPATSATIAQLEAFRAYGIKRYGLAVPYLDDVREAIIRVYGEEGFECVSSAHLGISVNFDFAEIGLDALRALIRRADSARAEAIVVTCTNLAAARLVEELELELRKPIFDSLLLGLWHPLRLLGWERPIQGWGRVLREAVGQADLAARR